MLLCAWFAMTVWYFWYVFIENAKNHTSLPISFMVSAFVVLFVMCIVEIQTQIAAKKRGIHWLSLSLMSMVSIFLVITLNVLNVMEQ